MGKMSYAFWEYYFAFEYIHIVGLLSIILENDQTICLSKRIYKWYLNLFTTKANKIKLTQNYI